MRETPVTYLRYFQIRAVPKSENAEEDDTGGAYVSCWINFALNDGAELLAKYYIEQAGWTPGSVDEHHWVSRASYRNDPKNMAFFEEAVQDGASFVFHSWPKNAEDADVP